MYRTQDIQKNEKFLKEIQDDRKSCIYYKTSVYLLDLYKFLRESTKEIIEVSVGNCISDVMVIVDNFKDNKEILDFFRNIITIRKVDTVKYHDLFIASYNKSSNINQNRYVIQQEIKVVKPKLIISFVDLKEINIGSAIAKQIDKDRFYRMCYLMKECTEEKQELKELKIYVWNKIKDLFKYVKPLNTEG